MMTSAENPASENSPQSIGELSNGQMAENYYASSKNGENGIQNSSICVDFEVP